MKLAFGWFCGPAIALAVCASCGRIEPLENEASREIHLKLGAAEQVRMAVDQGTVVHVRATPDPLSSRDLDHRELDLALRIAGHPTVNSHYGAQAAEELWWRADRSGPFELHVIALSGEGTARIEWVVADADSDLAERFWIAQGALDDLDDGHVDSATAALKRALAGSSPPDWRASTLGALAEARLRNGDSEAALGTLDEALDQFDGHRNPVLQALLLLQRGRLHQNAGRLEAAEADAQAATQHARHGLDLYSLALITNFQAFLDDLQGELHPAISGYALAAAQFGQAGAGSQQATALLNQARCSMNLGTMAEARSILDSALEAVAHLPASETVGLRAQGLADLGWWHHLEGRPEPAREAFEASLALRPDHIGTLDRLATTLVAHGALDRARQLYDRVEEAVSDQPFWRAHLATNLCRLELAADHLDLAETACRSALDGFDRTDALGATAETLKLFGQLELRRHDLIAAEAHLLRSVETIETQRRELSDRAPQFLAQRLDNYHLLIQTRMALHETQPEAGWDHRALEVFELTRARRLRDLLALEAGRSNVLPPPKVEAVDALKELLNPETAFVFYHLAEERSLLWWLTVDGLQSFYLPPRSTIEHLVRSWYSLLAEPTRTGPWSEALETRRAERLSQMLLDPLALHLDRKRLVFVVDGYLQRLPFGALPSPGDPQRPLIADHEIVSLPSASVLTLLRRMTADRPMAPGQIALIVDPVYDRRDERISVALRRQMVTDRSSASRGLPYARLVNTGLEAQAILALISDGPNLLLEGFQASRSRVLSGELAHYRIVHFATHAETGGRRPFGLVLSQVADDGRDLDGMLGLEELYGLRLPGELAVLSACGTGLGTDLEGEGLISLTRGFMHAGTPRVLISLWSVEDRASRNFMERFYSGLTEHCLCPSAALQKAQVDAWRAGHAKHRWAPFVLQGDWRRFPLCADPTRD